MRINAVSNLLWKFGERCGAQLVTFVVSLVIARIVDPEVYGVVAIVLALTSICQVFIDSGLGNCLIQKKDSDDIDFSSVFYFNIILCLILYIVIYLTSPYISSYFNNKELTIYIRVLSISILISGVKNIQQAYVSKKMIFKKFFFSTLFGTIVSGCAGILLAYKGYGIWAIIINNLLNQFIDTVVLWIIVKWRPIKKFSILRLKKLLPLGIQIFLSSITNTIYSEIRQLAIGKVYNEKDLAYYNRGRQFPYLFVENINTSLDGVLFPVLSSANNNISDIKYITKKAIVIGNYLLAPFLFGMAAIAKPLVSIILTEKWLFCVPYLKIFCLIYVFQPIHTANKNAIKALGKGKLLIKQEIINDVVGLSILFILINKGVYAITIGYLVSTSFNLIINAYPNAKLIDYSLHNQIKDIFPATALALVMSLLVYNVPSLANIYIDLIMRIVVGIGIYCIGSKLLKINAYDEVKRIISNFIGKELND